MLKDIDVGFAEYSYPMCKTNDFYFRLFDMLPSLFLDDFLLPWK